MKSYQKYGYLIHTWSDKALKGTVVNPAMSYKMEGYIKSLLKIKQFAFLSNNNVIKLIK